MKKEKMKKQEEGAAQNAEGISLGKAVVQRTEKANPGEHPNDPYIGLDDVEAHTMRLLGWKKSSDMKSSAKRFYPGDVLYSRLRPYLNKVWHADRAGLCSSEFIVLPPNDTVDGKFLKHRLNAMDFVQFANSLDAGDRPRVDFKQISSFVLPPFSLAEQKRIVAKIEELFSELDAGEENLRLARKQLGVYRQSLLKQAFEGRLTEGWRKKNAKSLESSTQLQARILSERQAQHQQQINEWEKTVKKWEKSSLAGKRPTKPRSPKEIRELGDDLESTLARLPSQWFWETLSLMTLGVEYGTAAKSEKEGECPVIRMGNVQRGEIDWDDLVFTSDSSEIDQYRLAPGDVLFNRTNSPEWVGKTAIYRGARPAVFAGYLIRVNHLPSIVDGSYLNYFLNSPIAKQHGSTVKTDGVNQSNINGEKLCNYPFPYCSLPEQQEIVRLLDEQFEAIEQNEREIDAALVRSSALRQSILKQAFAGKLAPQDASDEHAEAGN